MQESNDFIIQTGSLYLHTTIITALLIIFFSRISHKLGLLDEPGGRKKHENSTPLIGGIAIFLAASLAIFPSIISTKDLLYFWVASFLIVSVGIADDKHSISTRTRFIIQAIAISLVAIFGHTIIIDLGSLLGSAPIKLGVFAIMFTCFAMIGIINAVNMMDGIDGLTSGISIVEFSLLLFLALRLNSTSTQDILLIITFIAATTSFMLFNFNNLFKGKWKIFLGDSGSTLLGFTLAWLCVRLTQTSGGYPPVLMLWIMALPLMDTINIMINRKIRGVSVLKADRRHMHHILLQLQYTNKQTTLLMSLASLIIGATGISLCLNGVPEWLLFLGAITLFVSYMLFSYRLKKRIAARKYKFGNTMLRNSS